MKVRSSGWATFVPHNHRLSDVQPCRLGEDWEVCFVFMRRRQPCHGGWSKSDVKCERFDWEQREDCLLAPVSAVRRREMMGLSRDEKWRWNTFSFDTSDLRHFLCSVLCENSKRYLGFQPNFTQSGQSLCHHIIYHILGVVEMGGSVKITSLRVVILS